MISVQLTVRASSLDEIDLLIDRLVALYAGVQYSPPVKDDGAFRVEVLVR